MAYILRNQNNVSFTTVDNEFIFNFNLSTKAKGLLLQLLALPDNWNFSKEGIYAIVPEGKKFIDAALSELKEQGYLEINKVKNYENNLWDYEYNIYSVSRFCEYLPDGNIYNYKTNKKGRGITTKNKQNVEVTPVIEINKDELLIQSIHQLIEVEKQFTGTISELKDHLPNSLNLNSSKLSEMIRANMPTLEKDEIKIEFRKSHGRKLVQICPFSCDPHATPVSNMRGSHGDTQKGVLPKTPEKAFIYRAISKGDPQKGVLPKTPENVTKNSRGSHGDPQKGTLPNGVLYKRKNNKDIDRQIEKEVHENIQFDELLKEHPDKVDQELISTMAKLMVDTLHAQQEEICLGKDKYSREVVHQRLMELRKEHIELVLENVKKQKNKIYNIDMYLLKSLFTSTRSIKYQSKEISNESNLVPDWYKDTKPEKATDDLIKEVMQLQSSLK